MNLWDKREDESAKAYAAFVEYLEMGPGERSLRKLENRMRERRGREARRPGTGNAAHITAWSVKFGWVARCEAYDAYILIKRRQAHEEALLEMARRQAQQGKDLQAKGAELLKKLKPADARWQDARRLIIEGAELERLALGEPTTISKQDVTLAPILEIVLSEPDGRERGDVPDDDAQATPSRTNESLAE